MCIINYTEMARVTGVPFSYLITRGQQIKVMSQLYRKCRKEGLLIPTAARKAQEGDKFEGATVFKIQVPMERAEERFNTLEALFERLAPTT